ncbi:MAG: hypothetical protein HY303_02885 [Candidatus Wallbacteria bacterium]|nr:hypothetical protein [Candidatus Wallbacteria bacterium]
MRRFQALPRPVRREPSRKAFLLTLVPVVLLIVLGVLLVFNYLTRTQYHRGHAYRAGQEALYLAEGGLALAETWLKTVEGRALMGRMTMKALERLTGGRGGAGVEVVVEESLDLSNLRLLTAGFPEAILTANVRLTAGKPIVNRTMAGGIAPDPCEAEGRLEIVAACRSPHVTRRIHAVSNARIVSSLPPLLSRFVLLVCESGAGARSVNCLDYDSENGRFRDAASGARTTPLVVISAPPGSSENVPTRDAKGHVLRTSGCARSGAAALRVGWTYLGGPDPWFLQLAMGGGAFQMHDEQMLLRRAAYEVPQSSLGAGFQEKLYRIGFAAGASRLPMLGRPQARWKSGVTGEAVSDRTAFLHLSGEADSAAPAVVMGPVFRRYISFSKVRRGASGPFVSFVYAPEEADYARVSAPFEALTGLGFEAYKRVMARVVEEPYNRSFDYLTTSEEADPPTGRGPLSAGATPAVPPLRLLAPQVAPALTPVAGNASFLYPVPQPAPAAAEPVRLTRLAGGTPGPAIYSGDPGKLEGYDDLMRQRVTLEFPNPGPGRPQTFAAFFLHRGADAMELDLGGHVVHLKQPTLALPRIRVIHGGTLLVDGDVSLDSAVDTAPGEILTVVSLRGSIKLGAPGPFHVCLVALRGQVHPPVGGGLFLHGTVACRNLDNFTEYVQNAGPKKLVYDPDMDPATAETWYRHYRMVTTGDEQRYLDRR